MKFQIQKRKKRWFRGKESFRDALIGWRFCPVSYQGKEYLVEVWEKRKKSFPYEELARSFRYTIYEYREKTFPLYSPKGECLYAVENPLLAVQDDIYEPFYVKHEEFFGEDELPSEEILANLPQIMEALFERYEKDRQKREILKKRWEEINVWDGKIDMKKTGTAVEKPA